MKTLIVILTDYSYPFLEDMLADVESSGIGIIPAVVVNAGTADEAVLRPDDGGMKLYPLETFDEETGKDAYIITDCRAGTVYASANGIGYVYYEPGDDSQDVYETETSETETPETETSETGRSETGRSETLTETAKPQCIIKGFDEIGADFLIKMYERFHHIPWTILKTERLVLREMIVDDVDRLYEIYKDPSITRYMEPLYPERSQEVGYTRDYIKYQYEFCGYGLWIVTLADNSLVIGRVGITNREGYEEAELGYMIAADMQRRGYAAEACRAVIGYAGDILMMKGLNCFIQPGNDVSVHLCEQLGFTFLEDVILNGIDMMRYHIDLNCRL